LQIRKALGDIAEATRLIQAQPKIDELVVAVLPSFGRSWLLPRLPGFQRLYPHISIRLQASLTVPTCIKSRWISASAWARAIGRGRAAAVVPR
jgi:DNA-binding transcriptional LysR family regulator